MKTKHENQWRWDHCGDSLIQPSRTCSGQTIEKVKWNLSGSCLFQSCLNQHGGHTRANNSNESAARDVLQQRAISGSLQSQNKRNHTYTEFESNTGFAVFKQELKAAYPLRWSFLQECPTCFVYVALTDDFIQSYDKCCRKKIKWRGVAIQRQFLGKLLMHCFECFRRRRTSHWHTHTHTQTETPTTAFSNDGPPKTEVSTHSAAYWQRCHWSWYSFTAL